MIVNLPMQVLHRIKIILIMHKKKFREIMRGSIPED